MDSILLAMGMRREEFFRGDMMIKKLSIIGLAKLMVMIVSS